MQALIWVDNPPDIDDLADLQEPLPVSGRERGITPSLRGYATTMTPSIPVSAPGWEGSDLPAPKQTGTCHTTRPGPFICG
ncbi:hypothetical protein BH24CHL4_BH24CHL4_24960 [soil metagenome]